MNQKADIGEVFGRCRRIRTSDPFVPNEVRYQAAPHTGAWIIVLYQARKLWPTGRITSKLRPNA